MTERGGLGDNMHQFNEHHAELKGFSKYFHDEIFPFLDMQESSRREVIEETKRYAIKIGVIAVCLAILIYLITRHPKITIIPILVGPAAIVGIYHWRMKSIRGVTKEKVVGGVCKYIGWTFQSEVAQKPDLVLLELYGLIPRGYREKDDEEYSGRDAVFEDQMQGKAHGVNFTSVETHLSYRNDDKKVTAFRGQIITLEFPRNFDSFTVVLRHKQALPRKKRKRMKAVGLADPVFEKVFDAYSTDQVESRYLLDPYFMQKLLDLEHSVNGMNIRFGFMHRKLHIVVETGNRFEVGSMLNSLTKPYTTQKILDEIGAVYDIIDGVMEPQRG